MLKIDQLSHTISKQPIIRDLSLTTKPSGLYVFAGANGCGKSTLFNIICGLYPIQQGSIFINNTNNIEVYRSLIGCSIEPFTNAPQICVRQILDIARRIKETTEEDVYYWLKFWDLHEAIDKPFGALSVGMIKRLSLITSLLGNPSVYIWDEPFNGLDPLGIQKLKQLITTLLSQNKLILLSTHILAELSNTVEQVIIMEMGEIKKILTPPNKEINSTSSIISWLEKPTPNHIPE
ncbi:ABC transporter ATP-binding protein [Carboxylicivirga sediminis]|uniref:ABC transporter ATP-binding protein n=1 Tax=Carboxylicivirga sediminis TaxID=2006564 RepID=A0A941IXM7_9BACT|nr:ABC transporter ATP-binding protein [Carboxylicivirga sediminis]MBR8536956.1 ABC transporter ATP-binding protein [Carboxylicivirga sediminis]